MELQKYATTRPVSPEVEKRRAQLDCQPGQAKKARTSPKDYLGKLVRNNHLKPIK